MAVLASLLNVVGLIFLSHAVYSAYEHSLLPKPDSPSSSGSSLLPQAIDPKIDLPIDIALETIISALVLCVGVVLSSPDLKPIQWRVWAGQLERSKEARKITEVGAGGGNPYAALEERPGFLDARGSRRAFAAWIKDGAGKS